MPKRSILLGDNISFLNLRNNNTMSSFFEFVMNFLEINVIIRKIEKGAKNYESRFNFR